MMTEALTSSASKEVCIGYDRPFVIIGERINSSGQKILTEEMNQVSPRQAQMPASGCLVRSRR